MWPTEKASEDRAGLAQRATELARAALPGVDIEILWDGMWVRRVGRDYFPDPEMFRVAEPDWQRWAGQARKGARPASGARAAAGRGQGAESGPSDLDALSKADLLARAAELDIPGRSKMSKPELIKAIQAASRPKRGTRKIS